MNLNKYRELNSDLFEFRQMVRDIRIQMIKRGYRAFNKIRIQNGLTPLKCCIFKQPFQNSLNQDLVQQLKSINVVLHRDRRAIEESHHERKGLKDNLIGFLNSHHDKNQPKNNYFSTWKCSLKGNSSKEETTKNNDLSTLISNSSKNCRKYQDFEEKIKENLKKFNKIKILRKRHHKVNTGIFSKALDPSIIQSLSNKRKLTKKFSDFKQDTCPGLSSPVEIIEKKRYQSVHKLIFSSHKMF